jgi:hypothetical protein
MGANNANSEELLMIGKFTLAGDSSALFGFAFIGVH